ncbi:MAG TPA: hypothetical protein VNH11_02260 [Pirellulales bacterium]|nr:hypothetical protein [Pirellulales bacterium]
MMTDSVVVSRRGVFHGVLALLAACTALPTPRAVASRGAASGAERCERDGVLYQEFDKFGRVVLVVREGPRPCRWTTYYD